MRDAAVGTIPIPPGPRPEGTQLVARALIAKERKVLIIQRPFTDHTAAGQWCLPGGRGKNGEDVSDILIREVREELALRVVSYEVSQGFRYTTTHPPAWDVYHMVVQVDGYDYVLNPEDAIAAQWVAEDELDKYEFLTGDKEAIAFYFASLS